MSDRWTNLGRNLGGIFLELESKKKKKERQEKNEAFLGELQTLFGPEISTAAKEEDPQMLEQSQEVDLGEVFGITEETPDLGEMVSEEEADKFMKAYDTAGSVGSVLDELQTEETPDTEASALPASIAQQLGVDTQDKFQRARTYVDMLSLANKYGVSDTKILDKIMELMEPDKKRGTDYAAKYAYDQLMKGPGGLQWNLEQMKSEGVEGRQEQAHKRKMSAMERKYQLMSKNQQEKADDALDALNVRRNMKIYNDMDASIQETMMAFEDGSISKEEAERNVKGVQDFYEKQQEKIWEEVNSESAYLLPESVRKLKVAQLEDILKGKDKAIEAARALKVKGAPLDKERRKLEKMKAKFAKDARTKKGAERKKAQYYLQKVNEALQNIK